MATGLIGVRARMGNGLGRELRKPPLPPGATEPEPNPLRPDRRIPRAPDARDLATPPGTPRAGDPGSAQHAVPPRVQQRSGEPSPVDIRDVPRLMEEAIRSRNQEMSRQEETMRRMVQSVSQGQVRVALTRAESGTGATNVEGLKQHWGQLDDQSKATLRPEIDRRVAAIAAQLASSARLPVVGIGTGAIRQDIDQQARQLQALINVVGYAGGTVHLPALGTLPALELTIDEALDMARLPGHPLFG